MLRFSSSAFDASTGTLTCSRDQLPLKMPAVAAVLRLARHSSRNSRLAYTAAFSASGTLRTRLRAALENSGKASSAEKSMDSGWQVTCPYTLRPRDCASRQASSVSMARRGAASLCKR